MSGWFHAGGSKTFDATDHSSRHLAQWRQQSHREAEIFSRTGESRYERAGTPGSHVWRASNPVTLLFCRRAGLELELGVAGLELLSFERWRAALGFQVQPQTGRALLGAHDPR